MSNNGAGFVKTMDFHVKRKKNQKKICETKETRYRTECDKNGYKLLDKKK